jgi:hypothetical protein
VVLLHHVDHEGGEDEHNEADVHGSDQLLQQSAGKTVAKFFLSFFL